jgi:hypothetical protein
MSLSQTSLDTAIASLNLLSCLRRQAGREQWFLEHKARAIAEVVTLACDESDADGQDALFALIKIIDLM